MTTIADCTTTQHAEIIALAHEIAPTMPGAAWCVVCAEAERLQAELAQYADGWDQAAAAAQIASWEPQPTSPTPYSARERAEAKAQYHLAGGLDIRTVGSAHYVPSGTRGGIIHRVQNGICSCEAGQSGKPCWHVAAVELREVTACAA